MKKGIKEKVILVLFVGSLVLFTGYYFTQVYCPYNFRGGVKGVICELEDYDIDYSCGASIYCYTYLKCHGLGTLYFEIGEEEFLDIFEINKTYVVYYTEQEFPSGTTTGDYYWAKVIVKICNTDGSILWESWRMKYL